VLMFSLSLLEEASFCPYPVSQWCCYSNVQIGMLRILWNRLNWLYLGNEQQTVVHETFHELVCSTLDKYDLTRW